MAGTDRRTIARESIQSLAEELDLDSTLDILSERWNTVAVLGGAQVVAKTATLAHLSRVDPERWFAQEVRVCAELTALGAPVQRPFLGLESCFVRNGIPITLWHQITGEMAGSSESELVDSLAELHQLGQDIVLYQPWFATITQEIPGTLSMLVERGSIPRSTYSILNDHLHRLLEIVDKANLPEGFVHGDAQRKNSMNTATGTIWIDLEETCRGPFAWDLACLTMNQMYDTDRVLDRYALKSGTDRISVDHLNVLKGLRDLEGTVWMLAIQDEREPAFRESASEQLQRVLTDASGG